MPSIYYTIISTAVRNYHNPDIIHRPVLYLKHNVSETEFCFRLQVEPEPENGDRIQSMRRRVFNKMAGRWIISRIVIVILI
jgi:hypothetical protein